MSVRRLAPKEMQPANFAFTDENLAFAKNEIAEDLMVRVHRARGTRGL